MLTRSSTMRPLSPRLRDDAEAFADRWRQPPGACAGDVAERGGAELVEAAARVIRRVRAIVGPEDAAIGDASSGSPSSPRRGRRSLCRMHARRNRSPPGGGDAPACRSGFLRSVRPGRGEGGSAAGRRARPRRRVRMKDDRRPRIERERRAAGQWPGRETVSDNVSSKRNSSTRTSGRSRDRRACAQKCAKNTIGKREQETSSLRLVFE